ncbi:FAD-binding domain-containing protein [Ferruginibacter sp.]|nr:deoxyribodipyrimidine photolyase [Ferruginibacter sp.]
MEFTTDYKTIVEQLENIDALNYAASRNYIDGAVTYLSPYISRGVISLAQVKEHILNKYSYQHAEKLLQELAWREYWQRVWQHAGDKIFTDIKNEQTDVTHHKMISAIENAATGIHAIDKSIEFLYNTGYMHNHCRMYIASIACNIGKAHWLAPSQWMYYHLLDGDLASNSLSWQWVAATFSSKKYYCNQENINKYCGSDQQNTFLNTSYDNLTTLEVPDVLKQTTNTLLKTVLPETALPIINTQLPTLVYNSYNLDPIWHCEEDTNRILLLEPSHFAKYPVSDKVLQFIIALSKNITDIQIFVGEFDKLQELNKMQSIVFKSHPAFINYKGQAESYDYLFPQVSGYFPSFFSYWKKCKKI